MRIDLFGGIMNLRLTSVSTFALTLLFLYMDFSLAASTISGRPVDAKGRNGKIGGNNFNPAISLILDGRYVETDIDELALPGFQPGGAEAASDGFGLGETEFSISANIDDKIYGWFTLAIEEEDGETKTEIEEGFIESIGLGSGITLRGGRWFSLIGYENHIHEHALDFSNTSLVYDALLGGKLSGDGVQARWIAPTDLFLELGVELFGGGDFPGGESSNNIGTSTFFIRTGGDIGSGGAWRFGSSYIQTDFDERPNAEQEENEFFALTNGDADIFGVDFAFKWSPNGNPTQRNFKLITEYYRRDENGTAELTQGINSSTANYDGDQVGFYVQALYQWQPGWRTGLRFDQLSSDNTLSNISGTIADADFIETSGLVSNEDPQRVTLSVDYSPSEFSRFRLQYSQTDTGDINEDTIILQYLVSLGAHPAHAF